MRTDGITCSCNNRDNHEELPGRESRSNRFVAGRKEIIKMAIPAFVFIIIPKCPVCLAGYLALGTGIGLSFATATYLRMALIVICVLSMVYFVVKHIRRLVA